MSNELKISEEIIAMVSRRKSLFLSSLDEQGVPYASYAPYAIGDECLYILISDIAVHGINLKLNPKASVLIIEDEDTAIQLFARLRVQYQVKAECISVDSEAWEIGVALLKQRHGDMVNGLSEMSDFNLFKLIPQGGRYVKGFGKAYQIEGGSLATKGLSHLRDGHKKREV